MCWMCLGEDGLLRYVVETFPFPFLLLYFQGFKFHVDPFPIRIPLGKANLKYPSEAFLSGTQEEYGYKATDNKKPCQLEEN